MVLAPYFAAFNGLLGSRQYSAFGDPRDKLAVVLHVVDHLEEVLLLEGQDFGGLVPDGISCLAKVKKRPLLP